MSVAPNSSEILPGRLFNVPNHWYPRLPMIILHYHLFKNAGTSVDAMLKANFGERWVNREFDTDKPHGNAKDVHDFILANPELAALSSHTALMPVPQIESVEIFPIVFVRHPLLRLKSAYAFERRQGADNFSSKLAGRTDLKGYIEELLTPEVHTQAKNFQTHRLSCFDPDNSKSELERAQNALVNLPFVGLVEDYGRSIAHLGALLEPKLSDFKPIVTQANVSSSEDKSLHRKLEDIRAELGDMLFDRLLRANTDDLAIYHSVAHRYAIMAEDEVGESDQGPQ